MEYELLYKSDGVTMEVQSTGEMGCGRPGHDFNIRCRSLLSCQYSTRQGTSLKLGVAFGRNAMLSF